MRRFRFRAGACALVVVLAACGCGGAAERDAGSGERGEWTPSGKADEYATCEHSCGGQADAGCWCDADCEQYGDCCPDVDDACRAPGSGSSSSTWATEGDTGPHDPPTGSECEYEFFASYFDEDNGPEHAELRDATFEQIVARVQDLGACGADVTTGGLLSLMIYEGDGAKIAFFNDRCAENSYDSSSMCWTEPVARYSYQYGIAPVHTSNFHPCADVGWTSKMRARLEDAIAAAGFAPSPAEIDSVADDLATVCPGREPTAVDYYILSAHEVFGVPTNTTGNDIGHAGTFPFFTPRVMVDLFFDELEPSCAALDSDESAIAVFGGGDSSYDSPTKQAQILSLWREWQAQHCPP